MSRIASDPRGYALIGEDQLGAYILWPVVEGVYELHVGVLPAGRGEWAIQFSASTIEYMYTRTDCVELITRIPQGADASLWLARRFRFQHRWNCPRTQYRGKIVPYAVMSLTMFDWMPDDDPERSRIFAEMKRNGMGRKADCWYQRWAFLSAAEQVH